MTVVDGNGNNDDYAALHLKEGESKQALSYSYLKDEHPGSLLAVRDGTKSTTVIENESIALVYEVSGVYSALDGATASDLADGIDGIQLQIVGEAGMNEDERPRLDVGMGDLLVRPDEETVALVLDTSDVQASPGSEWTATMRFNGRDYENLTTTFTVAPVAASFESPLPPARTAIRGQTNYQTGSTVTLGIWARDGNIKQSRQITVGENGRITAPIDLRSLTGGTVQVRVKAAQDWHRIPVRKDATTTTATTTTTTTTAKPTATTASQTATQTPTTQQTTTTTATDTATPATATATATAAENATGATTTAGPNPKGGLLSGMTSILGWGVVVLGGGLVLANRIAD